MLRNLVLTALRALKKNRFFSFLNIVGLSIGMAVFMLIAQYVHFEKSYEGFIPGNEDIYRLTLTTYLNNELIMSSAENYPGAAPALKTELGEVEGYARLYNAGYKNNVIITYEDAKPQPIAFKHRRFLYADSSFLALMQYPLIAGDPRTALAEPLTAVVSEKYARMYFGAEDPLGKSIRMQDDDNNNELVKVTGVFKDIPSNTHLRFDVLFSYKTLLGRGDYAIPRYDQSWSRKDMYTFIKLRPGTNPKELEKKFSDIVSKYSPALKERNQQDILALQPIKHIHLKSSLTEEFEQNGDHRIVFFLSIIGFFVLIIAWINYINLATAKAMERANEVGVRKVMGALKGQLIGQFLAESALINLMSLLTALLLVILCLGPFNSLSGLSLDWIYLTHAWFVILVFGLWITGTLLSGVYPAFVLSSFTPVTVLKGKLKNSARGLLLRKSLVVFQFASSVALIAGTLIVFDQLNYMMSRDIGMNIDQVLVMERPGIWPVDRKAGDTSIDIFRNELANHPDIKGMSLSLTVPGKQREYKSVVKKYGASDDTGITMRINSMDDHFLEVFELKLLAGRAFSRGQLQDGDTSVVITESAAKLLGFVKPEDAMGQTITIEAFQWHPIVVGVVNDYHQVSLKSSIDPTLFFCTFYGGELYSVRLKTNNVEKSIENVKAAWQKAFVGNPFEYFFLDDYFNRQYENERKFGNLFTTFAGLAVIVGCLGLFGLSAFTTTQRTKEIGIRKVLGSSIGSIFLLLTREYLILIALALVIAVPAVYFIMDDWISSFSYRTTISWSIFVLAGFSVLMIALITISYQTLKAARSNPVESLRYE